MHIICFSAITIPEPQEFAESLSLMGTGFFVVMSVLCFLWLSISVAGKLFVLREEKIIKNTDALSGSNVHTSPAEEANDGISATTLALIAAAVQATINGPYRIVDIEHRHSNRNQERQVSNWSVEGRRSIFSSHQVR